MRRADGSHVAIASEVAPRFEEVAEEFCRNFARRGELGAACAAHRGGRVLFDRWGGIADRRSGAP